MRVRFVCRQLVLLTAVFGVAFVVTQESSPGAATIPITAQPSSDSTVVATSVSTSVVASTTSTVASTTSTIVTRPAAIVAVQLPTIVTNDPEPAAVISSCPDRYRVTPRHIDIGELPPITFGTGLGAQRRCVIAVDSHSGAILGSLYEATRGFVIEKVTVLPDMSRVFISETGDGSLVGFCRHRVVEVDAKVGTATLVGDGQGATLSYDGAYLAYATSIYTQTTTVRDSANLKCGNGVIVVRDMVSGDEWAYFDEWATGSDFTQLSWSPDVHRIAMSAWGADVNHVSVLDFVGREERIDTSGPLVDEAGELPDSVYVSDEVIGWTREGHLITSSWIIPYSKPDTASWFEEVDDQLRVIRRFGRDSPAQQVGSSINHRLLIDRAGVIISGPNATSEPIGICVPVWPSSHMYVRP